MTELKLHGTVEEQAAQLYDMSTEAMEEGRFSAAARYLAEIERAVPGFRDVPDLLAQAKQAKRKQRNMLWFSLFGGIVGIVLARLLGSASEWALLGGGVLGLALGYIFGLILYRR